MKAQHAPLSGIVTLSTPPASASLFLAPRLATLRRLYPDLHLTLLSNQNFVSLSQQEADIALRITRPQEDSSVTRKVGALDFRLYAAHGYTERPPADWQFIAYDTRLDHVQEQKWLVEFADERPIVFCANDLGCQAAAARAGVGIAVPRLLLGIRTKA